MKRGQTLVAVLLASFAVAQAHPKTPQLHFEYSRTLDSICSLFRGGSIKDVWRQELVKRQPEFEDLWWKIGPGLIATTETITGAQFPQDDQAVHLTLCDVPSHSFIDVAVNMRRTEQLYAKPGPVAI